MAALLQLKINAAKARLPQTVQARLNQFEQTDFLLRR